jgi:hypothetical protein
MLIKQYTKEILCICCYTALLVKIVLYYVCYLLCSFDVELCGCIVLNQCLR